MSLDETRRLWDQLASSYDDYRDHGLLDPHIRRAWQDLLVRVVGPEPTRIADLGSGTGTLAVLLAALGHRVTGLDLSPAMVDRARDKATACGINVDFVVGDASEPQLPSGQFDVVLARHVLWAMPNPAHALDHWIQLLTPGGRLVLIDGFNDGGGIPAEFLGELLEQRVSSMTLTPMPEPIYWGREINDERYLVSART
jgi:ubiquinone/menaquinone biosynthesis C-methylase UbiE